MEVDVKRTMGRTAIPQRSRLHLASISPRSRRDLRGKVSFQMPGSLTKEGSWRGDRGEIEGRFMGICPALDLTWRVVCGGWCVVRGACVRVCECACVRVCV